QSGEAYIFTGRLVWPKSIDTASGGFDTVIYGELNDDAAGKQVAAGDLDGDGKSDVIVTISGRDVSGQVDAGAVFGVWGAAALPASVDLATGRSFAIYGSGYQDLTGTALATGDFNRDGTADLAIGVPGGDGKTGGIADAGEVDLILGRARAS